jgi:hypothetical protein
MNGTYSIVYDSPIEGNITREQNVSRDRIKFHDETDHDISYWTEPATAVASKESLLESHPVVEKITKVRNLPFISSQAFYFVL